jgi:hypothetical protein
MTTDASDGMASSSDDRIALSGEALAPLVRDRATARLPEAAFAESGNALPETVRQVLEAVFFSSVATASGSAG